MRRKTILKEAGVLLAVTTLVLTSMIIPGQPTQKSVKANNTITWLSSAKTNNPSNEGDSHLIEPDKPMLSLKMTWLHYDDGYLTGNAIGWGDGSPFEWGIRLTPDELAPYNGCHLTTVKFMHGFPPYSPPVTQSGFIKIYNAEPGSTAPGWLVTTPIPWTHTMPGWVEVKLPSQVGINPYNDTWIIVNETTHYDPATGTPAGLDQIFAAKDLKGDWYKSGSVWEELQYGNPTLFDHNWNIWAGIDGISPVIPDLIIKEPSSLSIGDNVYDPPTLQSGTPFWKIKVMNLSS